jgi:hypothetical protein
MEVNYLSNSLFEELLKIYPFSEEILIKLISEGAPLKEINKKFREIYFNNVSKRYICKSCHISYTTKRNFVKHMLNKKSCEKKKLMINMILRYSNIKNNQQV